MNEQRQQAYIELLDRLMGCDSEEEIENLFSANSDLVDSGLVQLLDQVADVQSFKGNHHIANPVRKLAEKLTLRLHSRQVKIDEQRQQSYIDLINKLLNCGKGEEPEILKANSTLVDAGLLQTMEQSAAMLARDGKKEVANWLKSYAAQIDEVLEKTSSAPSDTKDAYKKFLLQLLEAFVTSNGDVKILHQLLTANLDKLDDTLPSVMSDWFNTAKILVGAEKELGLAVFLVDICSVIQTLPLGKIACNLEIAIAGHKIAAQVFNRNDWPQLWAITQHNLGSDYLNRIRGDRPQNIEQAICYSQAALEVRTREAFPSAWGQTQMNLGSAYMERIEGDRPQNIEQAICCYEAALQVCTRETDPQMWRDIQNNLGVAYKERIQGEKAENIERAIEYFQATLQVQNRQAFPQNGGVILQNLGNAYLNRIKGDRAENLEQAIRCYSAALEVSSREANPDGWADIQTNLANAYLYRIGGDRADNLEKAIQYNEAALQVHTREDNPRKWAIIQNNLGAIYHHRIRGKRADNLELEIEYCQAALQVNTREIDPQQWGTAHHNLGGAYGDRIRGEQAENWELAIQHYKTALLVRTAEANPIDWGRTANNLGFAYMNRIRGDRAENIEEAIQWCRAALQVRTRAAFPLDWADTQGYLAAAYSQRIRGDEAENQEQAIQYLEAALLVHTREADPLNWAVMQENLSVIYESRIRGDKAENVEQALRYSQAALQVRTREADPRRWATTQWILGNAYIERINGIKSENLKQAIACYQAALKVFTREDFPEDWAIAMNSIGLAYDKLEQTDEAISYYRLALEIYTPAPFPRNCFTAGKNLGETAFANRRWAEAIEGYDLAIEALETSRSWSSTDARRQEILVGAFLVYHKIVQACINQGQLDKALEYVERSRSRRLVDLLASNDLYSSGEIDSEIEKNLQEYESLQQRIDRERASHNKTSDRQLVEIETSSRSRAALNATQQAIASLEAEKQKLWEQLRRLDPVLAGQVRVSAPNSTAIKQLIDCPTTAILSFYSTNEDTHVFVLRQNQITYHCCSTQGGDTLQKWIVQQWVTPYLTNNNEWKSQTHSVFAELARRLQLDNLIAQHLSGIEELIVVPHLYLHLIPFAALPIADDRYLGDKFLIRYAPSCQVLEFCQKRQELDGELNCGIVEDATDDLPCATFEGEQVAQLFNIPARLRLKGRSQATVSNYRQLAKQVQVLLSSHHAQSRLDNPLESKLILGDGSITLGQLMTPGWRLPNLSDVFLSCCETGLGITPITDDILTLATGFLCAGARSVVNTLWAVDDLATALFSIFYHQHRQRGSCRPAALQQAQEELRTLTGKQLSTQYQPHLTELLERKFEAAQAAVDEAEEKLDQYAEGSAEYLAWEQEHEKHSITATRIYNALEGLEFRCSEDFPFAHPYYWAAFTCSGLR